MSGQVTLDPLHASLF